MTDDEATLVRLLIEERRRNGYERGMRVAAEQMAADAEERYGELMRERDELLREVETLQKDIDTRRECHDVVARENTRLNRIVERRRAEELPENYPKIEAKNAKDDCYYWGRGNYELKCWHAVRTYNYKDKLFFLRAGSECELYPDDISDLRGPIPEPEDE